MISESVFSDFFANPRVELAGEWSPLPEWLDRKAPQRVRRLLANCPNYQATPLQRLDRLARELGLNAIVAKDESSRMGLDSFKALGGTYALAELVLRWATEYLGRSVRPDEILSAEVRCATSHRTVCCATDGNHGLSVAAGARLFGCAAVIFVHQNVDPARSAQMREIGARIVEVSGTYDDSVDECFRIAQAQGWDVVPDTSWDTDSAVPALVMQGYTVLVDEVLSQMDQPLTHVFVQGGVGGLVAAVAGHLTAVLGRARPKIIVVEPDRAGCLFASALVGRAVEVPASQSTVMSMLECYRPSKLAWPVLDRYVDAFATLPDVAAEDIVGRLANPLGSDPPILTTSSGGAGIAGLIALAQSPRVRWALGLDHRSTILTIITENVVRKAAKVAAPQ